MNQAISAYHSVTASPEFRELAHLRTKAQHDEAQALYSAEQKGIAEGETQKAFSIAKNMIADGEPVQKITRYTGLTRDEIAEIGRR